MCNNFPIWWVALIFRPTSEICNNVIVIHVDNSPRGPDLLNSAYIYKRRETHSVFSSAKCGDFFGQRLSSLLPCSRPRWSNLCQKLSSSDSCYNPIHGGRFQEVDKCISAPMVGPGSITTLPLNINSTGTLDECSTVKAATRIQRSD